MAKYYAEIDVASREFSSEEEAIKFFRDKYGSEVMAVICDDTIEAVWEADKFKQWLGRNSEGGVA